MPLTKEQFSQLRQKGLSVDQIISFEQGNKPAPAAPTDSSSGGGFGGFLKGLVSAPATILARPFQAVAELAGVSDETVNRVSSKLSGGLVAPTPQNMGDVKKDVGRAVETVALGAGPVSGGALVGLGNSLQQGNDLFSLQTAFQTALGATGGKILGLIGKPVFNAVGKVVGEVTPKFLQELSGKGTQAITDFAASHNIFPEGVSKTINNTANTAEKVLNAPFDAAGTAIKNTANKVADSSIVQNTANKFLPQTPERLTKNENLILKARENISNVYRKTIPLTPTQLAKEAGLLTKTGDDVFTTLAKHDINVGSPDHISQLEQVSDQFNNAIQYAKSNETAFFNVGDVENNAFRMVDERIPSGVNRTTAKNRIKAEIDAVVKDYKDKLVTGQNGEIRLPADAMERLRRIGNDMTPFNASDPEKVGKSTGFALSNAVRDQVEKEGTFPAYREANKEWGKVIHAQEVMGKIADSGKKFKVVGGLSGSVSRKILSGILGFHTGGLGGAVLAELGSETAAKVLSNPQLRTYFDRKLIENLDKKITPEVIQKLEQEVKAFIDNRGQLLALPAPNDSLVSAKGTPREKVVKGPTSPSFIPMGPKTPNPSTVELVPAQKRPVSVNPKTGKFQTSYLSNTNTEIPPTTAPIKKANIINKTVPPKTKPVKGKK